MLLDDLGLLANCLCLAARLEGSLLRFGSKALLCREGRNVDCVQGFDLAVVVVLLVWFPEADSSRSFSMFSFICVAGEVLQ